MIPEYPEHAEETGPVREGLGSGHGSFKYNRHERPTGQGNGQGNISDKALYSLGFNRLWNPLPKGQLVHGFQYSAEEWSPSL